MCAVYVPMHTYRRHGDFLMNRCCIWHLTYRPQDYCGMRAIVILLLDSDLQKIGSSNENMTHVHLLSREQNVTTEELIQESSRDKINKGKPPGSWVSFRDRGQIERENWLCLDVVISQARLKEVVDSVRCRASGYPSVTKISEASRRGSHLIYHSQ